MQAHQDAGTRLARKGLTAALAAVVALSLAGGLLGAPRTAEAAQVAATGFDAVSVQAVASGSTSSTSSGPSLATAKKSAIDKTVVKNAKAMVKKAKATSGTATQKLDKIYAYVATAKKWKGTYSSVSYLSDFYFKARGTANAKYYPATQPKNMKTYYKKYAIDAYKTKKAVCYHYAALFAVAAKQALGKQATVKIAVGGTNVTGIWNTHHAWVEVTIGKATYVYDPMNGYYYSTSKAKKKGAFGPFCGKKKSSNVKKYYKNFKGAKYCTVKL